MRDLPIYLEKIEVDLLCDSGRTGLRWTLGPTWYENQSFYDGGTTLPYYEAPDDFSSIRAPEGAKIWAEKAIARTTDYRVVGWDEERDVPILDQIHHTLEVWTTSGSCRRYAVSGVEAQEILDSYVDPEGTVIRLAYLSDSDPDNVTCVSHYARAHVTNIEHFKTRLPVESQPER